MSLSLSSVGSGSAFFWTFWKNSFFNADSWPVFRTSVTSAPTRFFDPSDNWAFSSSTYRSLNLVQMGKNVCPMCCYCGSETMVSIELITGSKAYTNLFLPTDPIILAMLVLFVTFGDAVPLMTYLLNSWRLSSCIWWLYMVPWSRRDDNISFASVCIFRNMRSLPIRPSWYLDSFA